MSARLELAEAAAFAEMWEATGRPLLRLGGATCIAHPPAPANVTLDRVIALVSKGPSPTRRSPRSTRSSSRTARNAIRSPLPPRRPPTSPPSLRRAATTRATPGCVSDARPPSRLGARRHCASSRRRHPTRSAGCSPPVSSFALQLPGTGLGTLIGRDGWHTFLAYDGDEPVGAAALYAHDRVGWFGPASTVPEHRRKGAQSALLAARIEQALALGLDELTAETGDEVPDSPSDSRRNIVRAGFTEAYLRSNLLSRRAT